MSVLQTVQKNNRQFTYGQTVQKKQQTIYIWTDSAKKTALEHLQCSRQCKKNNSNLHMDRQCKKTTNNLHMDRQCKKATAIYIWTVHIYRLYRRQCAKYTYIYSVRLVYYKDITLTEIKDADNVPVTLILCRLSSQWRLPPQCSRREGAQVQPDATPFLSARASDLR